MKVRILLWGMVLSLLCGAACADGAFWVRYSATLNQKMATRSGPGTEYTEELGTHAQRTQIVVLQQEMGGSVPWAMVEFSYKGGLYRAYTGMKRINTTQSIPWADENPQEALVLNDVRVFYGPGQQYVPRKQLLAVGMAVHVLATEQGYALIDYYETIDERVRAWAPVSALSILGADEWLANG